MAQSPTQMEISYSFHQRLNRLRFYNSKFKLSSAINKGKENKIITFHIIIVGLFVVPKIVWVDLLLKTGSILI